MTTDTYEKVLHRLQHAAGSARELITQEPAWLKQELLDIAGQVPTSPVAQDHPSDKGEEKQGDVPNPKRYKKEKAQRPFHFHKFGQRFVALEIMYVGWRFQGFARQESTVNTIEGHLFHALKKTRLIPEDADTASIRYSRCGRTDKGVSGAGQVVALLVRSVARVEDHHSTAEASGPRESGTSKVPEEGHNAMETESPNLTETNSHAQPSCVLPPPEDELDYPFLLNKVLPEEIRVLGWRPVPDSFHARFSTSYREYKYFIVSTGLGPGGRSQIRNGDVLVPQQNMQQHSQEQQQQQQRQDCSQEAPQVEVVDFDLCSLGIARMREAAQHFIGEHDFRNFCKPDVLAVRSFVRRIMSFEIEPVDASCGLGGDSRNSNGLSQVYVMTIKGTAFLWHQVRCMAAVLLLVGRGLEEPGIVARMLDLKAFPAKPQYAMAPEEPLLLHDCGYSPPLAFLPPRGPNSSTSTSLCSMVERHLIGAALCAAITERAYKREAEGLDGSASLLADPHQQHEHGHNSQQQQASTSSGVGDTSHCAPAHVGSRGSALHEGRNKGHVPSQKGISSHQAECSDSSRGRRHPGGQQGAPGDNVGRRFVRNYVPLSLRKMEQSIEERLQKHGLVNTETGFQKLEEDAE